MPAKMARSAPRPPFGLPELTVAVRTSLLSCRKPENHEYSSQFGSHKGNPGLEHVPKRLNRGILLRERIGFKVCADDASGAGGGENGSPSGMVRLGQKLKAAHSFSGSD